MYNLNISLTTPPLLGVDGGICTTTPRTPEILNSLIAMTNPLDSYPAQLQVSQPDSHSSCSGSPLDSPAGNTAPPSVQKTCSQLIKAGLKLSIQSKRKLSGGDSSGTEYGKMSRKDMDSSDDDDFDTKSKCGVSLTPEDEDRRRRRRERNKIAATKCRMKKRERTLNLVTESESLETQNIDLKTQVRALETQRRKLMEALQSHSPACMRQGGYQPLPNLCYPQCKYISDTEFCDQQQQQQQPQQQNGTNGQIQQQQDIKYCQQQQQQQLKSESSPTEEFKLNGNLPPGYCKQSPTDIGYALSPDSGFIKSPADIDLNSYCHMKNDYIPNCENSNGGSGGCGNGNGGNCNNNNNNNNNNGNSNHLCNGNVEFILKSELVDSSPYTTQQSADRFLFENSENYDNDRLSAVMKDNNNTSNIEYNGSCQNFDTNLLKSDFLSQSSEFLSLTETQFTDLDSGITTYTNISNGGCLA